MKSCQVFKFCPPIPYDKTCDDVSKRASIAWASEDVIAANVTQVSHWLTERQRRNEEENPLPASQLVIKYDI